MSLAPRLRSGVSFGQPERRDKFLEAWIAPHGIDGRFEQPFVKKVSSRGIEVERRESVIGALEVGEKDREVKKLGVDLREER